MNCIFKEKTLFWCEKLAMLFLCIVMFDSGIFGAGEIIHIGPIGFRQGMLLLLGFCCIPLFIVKFKEFIKNRFIWVLLIFAMWLGFEAIRGFLNQNPLMHIDFSGYVYYIFIPLALIVVDSKKKAETLMRTMIYASFVLSLIVIAYLIIYLVNGSLYDALSVWGLHANFSRIGYITSKIPRIYMISGLYMIAGCAFSIYFAVTNNIKHFKWIYYITPATCLFATLLSYTRSVFLGFIAAAIFIIGYYVFSLSKEGRKKLFIHMGSFASLCIIITLSFTFIAGANYIGFAISRSTVSMESTADLDNTSSMNNNSSTSDSSMNNNSSTSDSRVDNTSSENINSSDNHEKQEQEQINNFNELTHESDKIRTITVKETIEHIKKSPIIGHGLGFTVPSRSDGNEYTYLDIWMKLGIVGLVLFLLPIIFMLVKIFKTTKEEEFSKDLKIVWLAFLLGIMAYSVLNPYITSSLGIFVLGITMAISQNIKKQN